jgi:hypothetical protein
MFTRGGTVRIRLLQALVGPETDFVKGQVVDVPARQAKALCDGVRAEAAEGAELGLPPVPVGPACCVRCGSFLEVPEGVRWVQCFCGHGWLR